MSEDDLTRPERAAQIRQAKRYKRAIEKRGVCSGCLHREKDFSIYHCRNKPERTYPKCANDGQQPKFQFDDTVLGEFADAA